MATKKIKKVKIFKIAKELNLANDTIIAYLAGELDTKVKKGHLSGIEQDKYLAVLKHFDQDKYNVYKAKLAEGEAIASGDASIEISKEANEKEAEALAKKLKKDKATEVRKLDSATRAKELDAILSASEKEINQIHDDKKKISEEKKARRRVKKELPKKVTAKVMSPSQAADTIRKNKEAAASTSGKKDDIKSSKPKTGKDFKPTSSSTVKGKDAAPAINKAGKDIKKAKPGYKNPKDIEAEKKAQVAKASLKRKKHKKAYGVVDSQTPVSTQKKRKKRRAVDETQVANNVKDTLKKMNEDTAKVFKRIKKKKKIIENGIETEQEVEVNVISAMEFLSTNELCQKLEVPVTELISKCFLMGMMITMNQRLDKDTIELIANEYEFEVEFESEFGETDLDEIEEEVNEADLKSRQPIITIMGHVDHGKTSLLDYLRHSSVVDGESGGITQHIGAYEVSYNNKNITFLDTPGHEAFTAMRARGAKTTDIVIVVIAADDRVMPQTIEALDHAKNAGVPIVIAFNKMDKSTADPERLKQELSQKGILVEEWGGKYQAVPISAKTGDGIDELLEAVLLEADMLELKANPTGKISGTVIESRLDKGLGPVATILMHRGTLKIGDIFVCGQYSGKVRAMLTEGGTKRFEAGPSVPVVVLGFSGTPNAGDTFVGVKTESEAKSIASKRQQLNRIHATFKTEVVTLDQVSEKIKLGEINELNIILKGDVAGSIEAISDSIMKLATNEVAVKIVHHGVGSITENDVLLAKASKAIIMGFHVRPNTNARDLALRESIEIRQYNIIYDLIAEIRDSLEGMLVPTIKEDVVATIEVRMPFKVPKIGTIAGSYVQSGKVTRNAKVRLFREDIEIFAGKISSLRRLKDDVKEVLSGFECGIGIENYNDIKEGDIMEVIETREIKRKLGDKKQEVK